MLELLDARIEMAKAKVVSNFDIVAAEEMEAEAFFSAAMVGFQQAKKHDKSLGYSVQYINFFDDKTVEEGYMYGESEHSFLSQKGA